MAQGDIQINTRGEVIQPRRVSNYQENRENAREAMTCCNAALTCGKNYGRAAIINGITACVGYILAANASEITEDPDGNSALYGISMTLAVFTTFTGLYNATRYLCKKCCGTNVNEATASNPSRGVPQQV